MRPARSWIRNAPVVFPPRGTGRGCPLPVWCRRPGPVVQAARDEDRYLHRAVSTALITFIAPASLLGRAVTATEAARPSVVAAPRVS